MKRKTVVWVLAALFLMGTPMAASGVTAGGEGPGLWSSDTPGTASSVDQDCGTGGGSRAIDPNEFCYVDDSGAVELGVKFTTSKPVYIEGVRVYRVDAGSMTGSLWTAAGKLLATGSFTPASTHGWQNLNFDSPVPITPGQTYVASYFAPNADYAFDWDYFTTGAYTVGPLTAIQSVEGDRNGVYCYVGDTCGSFPTNSFKDTNYWVTPVVWEYPFDGFYQPIDNGVLNVAKAGSAIPVKFSLGSDVGLDIFKTDSPSPTFTSIPCDANATADQVEEISTATVSTLTYDAAARQYVYVWKTAKTSAGSCLRFNLALKDGSNHTFDVKLVK